MSDYKCKTWCFFCHKTFKNIWTKELSRPNKSFKDKLNSYYLSQGKGFRKGNLIHWLKPKSYSEWIKFCEKHDDLLPTDKLMNLLKPTDKELQEWKFMLRQQLYFQLYLPEIKCIEQLKIHFQLSDDDIEINTVQAVDTNYGFDIYFYNENEYIKNNFVAVKWKINSNLPSITNKWNNIKFETFNNKNMYCWLYEYLSGKFYKYDYKTKELNLIYEPKNKSKYEFEINKDQKEYSRYNNSKWW